MNSGSIHVYKSINYILKLDKKKRMKYLHVTHTGTSLYCCKLKSSTSLVKCELYSSCYVFI